MERLDLPGLEAIKPVGSDFGGSTYVAVQSRLGREVIVRVPKVGSDAAALERFDAATRVLAELSAPGLPVLVAAGVSDDLGAWAAFRRVSATPFDRASRRARLAALGEVAAALDALHRADLAHGALDRAGIRIVAGAGRLEHAGLGGLRASPRSAIVEDRVAFIDLLRSAGAPPVDPECPGPLAAIHADAIARRARRRRLAAAGAAVALVGGGAVGLIGLGADGDGPRTQADALPQAARTVECGGAAVLGVGCTLVQSERDGEELELDAPGTVTSWEVRGAQGQIALALAHRRGEGRWTLVNALEPETVAGGTATFDANLPLRAGDYLALQLEAGATASIVPGAESTTLRWRGRGVRRLASADPPNGLPGELLFEATVRPGSDLPEPITGAEARAAPAGRALAARVVEPLDGRLREVRAVLAEGELFIDLIVSRRRAARVPVPDASPTGSDPDLDAFEGRGPNAFVFTWRNDGAEIRHSYLARGTTLVPLY